MVSALASTGCRFIAHNGAGYDQISIPECTANGIQVSNVPGVVDAATADTALFLLLGALRMFNAPLQSLRVGEWRGKEQRLGRDPEGKVLGVLGMGGIGSEVARRAGGLGMRVWYHNRRRVGEGREGGGV